MLMALARALPQARDDQQHAKWDWARLRRQSFLLGGQKTLIVGYGAIARRLVELLAPYKLDVTAFRRTVRFDENVHTLPIGELDAHLPTAQIVINILPLSDTTKNFFTADRLAKLRKTAIYLNIGRGDTVDQDALTAMLQERRLRYAYLDVTAPEPLQPDSPLWKLPNCFITPHTAGGTFDEPERMIEQFVRNLERFIKGEQLSDRVV
jgi:phosphoglycerate dehydrogenase-like enzyme